MTIDEALGVVALWVVLLLAGGADRPVQAPAVTTDASQSGTTVHAPTDAGALDVPTGPFAVVAGVRLFGEADGETPVGPPSISSSSSASLGPSAERAVAPGRRAPRAQSCAVLCVFLC